jgi:hypothetical protein
MPKDYAFGLMLREMASWPPCLAVVKSSPVVLSLSELSEERERKREKERERVREREEERERKREKEREREKGRESMLPLLE